MSKTEEKQSAVCWVCDHTNLKVVKKSDLDATIDSSNFAITNSDYGKTGELSKCENCGFIQCTDGTDVIHFYEDLVDEEYENTRAQRKLQEQRIMKLIQAVKPSGKHLDIGAGSGIMVEAAIEMGYDSIGVEPSKWLQKTATEKGLPIKLGIFPMEGLDDKFDVITLVDVIEHVNNPKQLMQDIQKALAPDGLLVVITPDVDSFLAKRLKWKWWHFRIAHIGYFNSKTMDLVAKASNLKTIKFLRPAWYFNLGYLIKRGYQYLPKFLRIPVPGFISKRVVRVNLRDSLLYMYKTDKP
ncbi:MAG: class I SAM-dependent methyltransferase [Bacteroidia bacterium]|nr:class I SAM-dependent methyltransferase [Bacteroidia bacterium]